MSKGERVFLGVPCGTGRPHKETARAVLSASGLSAQQIEVVTLMHDGSVLTNVFNRLWASALQNVRGGVTHFAMLHSDVGPENGWLGKLLDELVGADADLVSVVLPIKNDQGLTSTGLGEIDEEYHYRRLTMKELYELPVTFTADDVEKTMPWGKPGSGRVLIVNTGCWVCDLRRPFWTARDEHGFLKMYFANHDRIRELENGQFFVEFAPEDWLFSRMCHAAGAKVAATRAVKCLHYGEIGWPNDKPWGRTDTDTELETIYDRLLQPSVN